MGSESAAIIQKNIVEGALVRIDNYLTFLKKKQYNKAGMELGWILHTLQDSWTTAHTARDDKGNILKFHDYAKQDPHAHGLVYKNVCKVDSKMMKNQIKHGVLMLEAIHKFGANKDVMRQILIRKFYNISGYNPSFPNPHPPAITNDEVIDSWIKVVPGLKKWLK